MDREDQRKRDKDVVAVEEQPKKVRIVPVRGRYIPGVPAVEQELDAAEAERLLAYTPPAFRKVR